MALQPDYRRFVGEIVAIRNAKSIVRRLDRTAGTLVLSWLRSASSARRR
ncbi:hypothetical protein X772_32080 [Mesorhizobium sp. LSJC280B00]|nr:hypothetical protein X772_32080 [Mesorhizobium sp. LSJC280B00]